MWSNPEARLPGKSGPWWPIRAVQWQPQQQQTACTASLVLVAFACSSAAWATVQRRSALSSQGSNLWGICFFFKLLQSARRRNKAAEGGGATRDLLLSWLPLISDASSSASLSSPPPPPLFHSSNLPKVSALSFLFRQAGGEEVSGAMLAF